MNEEWLKHLESFSYSKKDFEEFDKTRTEYGLKSLEILKELQTKFPHMRVGQLISNACKYNELPLNEVNLFYLNNQNLYEVLINYSNHLIN